MRVDRMDTQGATMAEIVSADKADMLNSGVVKSAEEQARSALAEPASAAVARKGAATRGGAKAKGAGGRQTARGNDGANRSEACEASIAESAESAKKGVFKAGARAAVVDAAADQLDEAPEFEGVGDARQKAIAARRATRAIRARRSAKSAGAAQAPGSGAGRKAAGPDVAAEKAETAKKGAQAQAAAQAKAAEAAGANAALAAAEKTAAEATGGAVAGAAAPIAGTLAGVIAAILAVIMLAQMTSALFGFWENEALKSTGTLTGVEQEIAAALKGYGFSNEATAAVLGNLKAESGMDPASDVVADGMFNYAYERACGLLQYTSTSPGTGEYWAFKNWCSANGKTWSDVSSQMEWTFSGNCGGTWSGRWSTALASCGYYSNCPGYTGSGWYSAEEFPSADDVVKATFSWMACYERPANGGYAHLDRRIEFAKGYLAKLTASAEGYSGSNAIVRAAYSQLGVPYVWGGSTPGVGLDCSGLTQYCYAQAGIPISHYTESQYAELTPIPLSQAEPGDILYRYGHVAIYIGGDEYIHEPHTGDVCRKATGIGYFTCALRRT